MSRASSKFLSHRALTIGAVLSIPALAATVAFAQQPTDEVTITVKRYRTLDKIDVAGTPPDIFARVTIGGHRQQTPVNKQQVSGRPNWKITHAVPRGKTNVKLELLDKDVLNPADVIDINRIDKKRDLDFIVDTSNCRVEGFVGISRCGQTISRTGQEKKKSEIDFVISVKKGK